MLYICILYNNYDKIKFFFSCLVFVKTIVRSFTGAALVNETLSKESKTT